jgi:hypothetical protein
MDSTCLNSTRSCRKVLRLLLQERMVEAEVLADAQEAEGLSI